MLPRFIARRVRILTLIGLVMALWRNRRDVERWLAFAKRSVQSRESVSLSSVLTEAKVRAAVTADPVLRNDPAIEDLTVRDGIVTLHTTIPSWPDRERHAVRLRKVNGVHEVICLGTPTPATAAG